VIDLTRALQVEGWMSETELLWLAEKAARMCRIVEVGTYLGRSARAMGDAMRTGGVVICVDPLTVESVSSHRPTQDIEELGRRQMENLSDLVDQRRVVLLRVPSSQALGYWPCKVADMVFIDGNHDYESVRADIEAARRAVRTGGLIAGHDYGVHPGVTRAVDELRSAFRPAGSIWVEGSGN
jgi:predicted O-methyltransferase YrrM